MIIYPPSAFSGTKFAGAHRGMDGYIPNALKGDAPACFQPDSDDFPRVYTLLETRYPAFFTPTPKYSANSYWAQGFILTKN